MKFKELSICLFICVGLLLSCQKGVARSKQALSEGQKHIYKQINGTELALYIFNPKGHSHEKKAPAVVFFHGGGWTGGSPAQFVPQSKYLASRGMVGITVQYRLYGTHKVTVDKCIEDAKSAMRWVRVNAEKLGIDPDRIASGGGSAGGHLAACTAVMDGFNAEGDNLKISSKPNAMLLFNPALALADDPELSPKTRKTFLARKNASTKKFPADANLEDYSPLNFVSEKQAPCIIFFGTNDWLLDGANVFSKRSKAFGNDSKLVTYEGAAHGFFNQKKYFDLTIAEVDKFLVKLGWLTK